MREILFRGKNYEGEWVYGYYGVFGNSYTPDTHQIYVPFTEDEKKQNEGHIFSTIGGVWNIVLPETVGQYTGLTDKNGTKIFEGGVVAGAVHWLERMKNGVVAFKDGSFGLIWYRGEVEQFNPFTSMCNVEYEVIGNIHDNPELIGGE